MLEEHQEAAKSPEGGVRWWEELNKTFAELDQVPPKVGFKLAGSLCIEDMRRLLFFAEEAPFEGCACPSIII